MTKELVCITCGGPREIGRRQCRECYLKSKRERSKKAFDENGRYVYTLICEACQNTFTAWRKNQQLCKKCRKESLELNNVTSEYLHSPSHQDYHRNIAERFLQRGLSYNEIVHHVDGDPQNNNLVNLWVMGRGNHATLHGFLRTEQIIYLKNKENYIEKDWKTRQIKLSNQFIKDNNFKVIKLSKINNRSIVQ
jgi:hypothetical protein